MSVFFNFEEAGAALRYDEQRQPTGSNVIAELLYVHSGKPLKVSNAPRHR